MLVYYNAISFFLKFLIYALTASLFSLLIIMVLSV